MCLNICFWCIAKTSPSKALVAAGAVLARHGSHPLGAPIAWSLAAGEFLRRQAGEA